MGSFCDLSTKNVKEKFSFVPISFKLGSAYFPEDSTTFKKIAKKIIDKKLTTIYFRNFLFLESSETYAKKMHQNRSKNKNFSDFDEIFVPYVSNDFKKKYFFC